MHNIKECILLLVVLLQNPSPITTGFGDNGFNLMVMEGTIAARSTTSGDIPVKKTKKTVVPHYRHCLLLHPRLAPALLLAFSLGRP